MDSAELKRRMERYDPDGDVEDTTRGHVAGSYGIFLADIYTNSVDSLADDFYVESEEKGEKHSIKSPNPIELSHALEEEALAKRRKWFPSRCLVAK